MWVARCVFSLAACIISLTSSERRYRRSEALPHPAHALRPDFDQSQTVLNSGEAQYVQSRVGRAGWRRRLYSRTALIVLLGHLGSR